MIKKGNKMAKNITKQVLISILTIIAVSLVLALVLYKFTPSNKIVPAKVQAYSTPENVASEISDNTTEQKYETTNTVYEVTDSDLSLYKSSKSYNPGKSDPFATANETDESESKNENKTTSSSSETSNTNTSSINANTKNKYYEDAGINKGTK
jgi:hypothetical protein